MTTFVIVSDHSRPKPFAILQFADAKQLPGRVEFEKVYDALGHLPEKAKRCRCPVSPWSLDEEFHSAWRAA